LDTSKVVFSAAYSCSAATLKSKEMTTISEVRDMANGHLDCDQVGRNTKMPVSEEKMISLSLLDQMTYEQHHLKSAFLPRHGYKDLGLAYIRDRRDAGPGRTTRG
jgi:hypothetical protein